MTISIVVVGLGSYGAGLAKGFSAYGYDVVGVDMKADRVRAASGTLSKAVQGNGASPALWKDLPVKQVDIGVVAIGGDVASNLQAAFLLRKEGVKLVIAKSESALHTELLKAIGINHVIEPDKESTQRLLHTLGADVEDYLEVTRDFGIARITVHDKLKGTTVEHLFDKYKVTVLILTHGDRVLLEPPDKEELRLGDRLVIAGKDESLRSVPG